MDCSDGVRAVEGTPCLERLSLLEPSPVSSQSPGPERSPALLRPQKEISADQTTLFPFILFLNIHLLHNTVPPIITAFFLLSLHLHQPLRQLSILCLETEASPTRKHPACFAIPLKCKQCPSINTTTRFGLNKPVITPLQPSSALD